MNVSIFPKGLTPGKRNRLENITLRGFGGGWNAIETDLQMESTYLVKVRNFKRTPGGTQKLRFGSEFFADLQSVGTTATSRGEILDQIYFAARIVSVTTTGLVFITDGTGASSLIWSPEIAGAMVPPQPAWFTTQDLISFVPFKRELIIHSGRDKPIVVPDTFVVYYLDDAGNRPVGGAPGSGGNVNVPIGQYGCVVSNYHCVANINPHVPGSEKPTTIYISAVGTDGTFFGDPAPNDAVTIDVGAYAPQGAIEIRGIAGFRSNLLVFFQDQTVIVKLGTYETPPGGTTAVHKPFFPDTLPTFGLLGHRCIAPVENDLLFAGLSGMASARRNLLSVSGTLESQSLSERISPPYKETIGALTSDQQLKLCWMVYDSLGNDMLLFTPSGQVFVYSFSTKLRYNAWSEYSGITAKCGCRSFLGRVFYSNGLKIFQHGNDVFEDENYDQDRINDNNAPWANNTVYSAGFVALDTSIPQSFVCIVPHTSPAVGTFAAYRAANPGVWSGLGGVPITFEIELPWLDSKNPMQVKFLRFISLATKGNAAFTVKAYVDNLYKLLDGTIFYSPAVQMNFVGNEFGFVPTSPPRRSGDPRLYKFPCKFKTLKVVLEGGTGGALELVNMSFLFNRGKYRR